ncbi:hypothetical protein VTN96DRAFT_9908 [Rasamsonia emersonii]
MFYMDKNGRDDQSATLWMHWNTSGSEGFRNQLQFTQPWQTFSDWIATTTARSSNINANTEWFVRLDDQSMIPPELVDETEMRYQEWFRRRYPEMDRIRTSKDYLNRSFYENPFAVEIPIDQLFHPAHCILALRRYWQARETGRHVCPRDLDYKHVKHCLDSLDAFAFVEGPRGTTPEVPAVDQTTMPWLVNACF